MDFEDDASIEGRRRKAALAICVQSGCLLDEDLSSGHHAGVMAVRRQIEVDGVVPFIRSVVRSSEGLDLFLRLWSHKRLDLSFEALSIRPAWDEVFSNEERQPAVDRLVDALASPEYALRPPDDLHPDELLHWLHYTLRGTGNGLDLGWIDPSEIACDDIARAIKRFEETGTLELPLPERLHYRKCASCRAGRPELDSAVHELDHQDIALWRKSLDIINLCLAHRKTRELQLLKSGSSSTGRMLNLEKLMASVDSQMHAGYAAKDGRAFVCAAGACVPSVAAARWGLSSEPCEPFSAFCKGLTADDHVAMAFCSVVRPLACDVQIDLFGSGLTGAVDVTHLVLPTDGDLEDIPGVLQTIQSVDYQQWLNLMTGGEETWPRWFGSRAFFDFLYDTATLRSGLGDYGLAEPSEPGDATGDSGRLEDLLTF